MIDPAASNDAATVYVSENGVRLTIPKRAPRILGNGGHAPELHRRDWANAQRDEQRRTLTGDAA